LPDTKLILAAPLTVKLVSAVIEVVAWYVVAPDVILMFVKCRADGNPTSSVTVAEAERLVLDWLTAVTVTVCWLALEDGAV